MDRKQLTELIRQRRSYLCVGLDTDPEKIPDFLKDFQDPVFEFNRSIIDATIDLAVAYKPNLAFYESQGSKGWISLEKTLDYIRSLKATPAFIIADAKRGDIGNSASNYARAFFQTMDFDAVTVNPYMGHDTLQPFLGYPGKWAIVLALTSNAGARDFQMLQPQLPVMLEKLGIKTSFWDNKLYELVMSKCSNWGTPENLMFVVGATRNDVFASIRQSFPEHFFLVPGVGAQGGDLQEISKKGLTKDCGLLINASRSIIYRSSGTDFDQQARQEALALQKEMESLLVEHQVI
jgi:orotidine-5'-phosphate decarboxylase